MIANAKVAMPLAVLLRSIQETKQSATDLKIYIFCNDIEKAIQHKIADSAPELSLHFECLKKHMPAQSFPTEKRLGQETWGRFFAANHLADSHQTAVYLDTDTLVRKDLSELFRIEFNRHSLAAAPAAGNPTISSPNSPLSAVWKELQLAPDALYLQAGVLVFNLRAWKQRDVTSALQRCCQTHGCFLRNDMDAINLATAGEFTPLPLRWNQTHSLRSPKTWAYTFFPKEEVDEALGDPAIIHFSGLEKPWHEKPRASDESSLWWDCLSRTSFRDFRPSKIANGFRSLKIAIRRKLAS